MPGRRELAALSRRLDDRVWKSASGQRTFSAFQSHVRFWEILQLYGPAFG